MALSFPRHRLWPSLAAPLCATALAALATGAAAQVRQSYGVVDLGTLAQGTAVVVRGPNLAGVAVGGGRLVQAGRGVREGLVFERGATQVVPGLGGSDYTNVLGINDLGGIVGAANTASNVRAFSGARAGGTAELPPLPGDTASVAYAINNAGQSVGYSSGPGGERAVAWSPQGQPSALQGGSPSRAYAVNAQGAAAGVVGTGGARRGSLWAASGAAQELGPLQGYSASEAASINARGDVVGYSTTEAESRRATIWPAGGAPVDLGTLPGGTVSQAFGINEAGVVVGTCDSAEGMRACIWSGQGVQDLNTLASAAAAGVVLTKAVGINNAGMVVSLGHELPADGHTHTHDHEQPIRVLLLVPNGG